MEWEVWTILGLAVTLGMLTLAYARIERRLENSMEEMERVKKKNESRLREMLNKAREQAMEIIKDAKIASRVQSDELEKKLMQAIEEELAGYEQTVHRATQEAAKTTEVELEKFRETLTNETAQVERETMEKMRERMAKTETEVDEYKKKRLAQLDEEIWGVMAEVAKRTLGKSISIEDQKELILEALEDAKRNNVF